MKWGSLLGSGIGTALGAAVGTAIGGPVGGTVGAGIGGNWGAMGGSFLDPEEEERKRLMMQLQSRQTALQQINPFQNYGQVSRYGV
jgi:phage tail tape-measure protein